MQRENRKKGNILVSLQVQCIPSAPIVDAREERIKTNSVRWSDALPGYHSTSSLFVLP